MTDWFNPGEYALIDYRGPCPAVRIIRRDADKRYLCDCGDGVEYKYSEESLHVVPPTQKVYRIKTHLIYVDSMTFLMSGETAGQAKARLIAHLNDLGFYGASFADVVSCRRTYNEARLTPVVLA